MDAEDMPQPVAEIPFGMAGVAGEHEIVGIPQASRAGLDHFVEADKMVGRPTK
jgi:hypothetical protein